MGKRGPKTTPTQLKVLRGNPGCRPLNKGEPVPPSGDAAVPVHLGVVAAAKWRELLPLLQAMRVMTNADREALARYCDTYEWWMATRHTLRDKADTYPILNDAGEVKYIAQRPEVSIAHKLAVQLRQLEQDFGLNPSARTSLHVEGIKEDADDKDARVFAG